MKQLNLLFGVLFIWCTSLNTSAQNCSSNTSLGILADGVPVNQSGINLTVRNGATDSVWYSFTVNTDGYFSVSSALQAVKFDTIDTRVFLFKADAACTNLSLIATSDDDCGLSSVINKAFVRQGFTYYLLWDNKSLISPLSFSFAADFIALSSLLTPLNDNICNASNISTGSTLNGSNLYATTQNNSEVLLPVPQTRALDFGLTAANKNKGQFFVDNRVLNSVWYKFVANDSAVSVAVNAAFDAQVAIFTGDCNDFSSLQLVQAADDDSFVSRNSPSIKNYCLQPGTTYYILIDGFAAEKGNFSISLNDNFEVKFPVTALIQADTNYNADNAYCPQTDAFKITSSLIDADGNLVSGINAADYVNRLTYQLFKNGSLLQEGSALSEITKDVPAGVYSVNFVDACGNIYQSSDLELRDTLINPLDLQFVGATKPGCVGEDDAVLSYTVAGGYQFVNNNAAINGLKFSYKKGLISDAYTTISGTSSINISNTAWFSELSQGRYILQVLDACGKTDTIQFQITDPISTPLAANAILTEAFCPGTATGVAQINVTGGENRPYKYEWLVDNDPSANTNYVVFIPSVLGANKQDTLLAGNYQVVVSDQCFQTQTVNFTVVDAIVSPLVYTKTVTNPTSFAAKDGAIALTVSGGKPSYNLFWTVDGSARPDLNDMVVLNNLPQGIYHLLITDTCVSSGVIDTTFILLAPLANDTACKAIAITSQDSLIAYSNINAGLDIDAALSIPLNNDEGYTGWSDVNINKSVWFKFVAPQSGAVSLSAKHYTGLISNLNFDPQVAIFDLTACDTISSYTLIAANDNAFQAVVDPTTINDSYLEAYCLTPGKTYYVLVDGYQGIGEQGLFYLDLNDIVVNPITVTKNVPTASSCLGEKGKVIISKVNGGIYAPEPENYLYSYSFGTLSGNIEVDVDGNVTAINGIADTALIFDNLNNGTYTLTISDLCGVKYTENILIQQIVSSPIVVDALVTDATCDNSNDGSVELNFSGGGTPDDFTYSILKNNLVYKTFSGLSYSTDSIIHDSLEIGLYTVQIEDLCPNPNQKSFVFEVKQTVFAPFVATISDFDPKCIGQTGSITATATQGIDRFYYQVKRGSTYQSASVIKDTLVSGSYTLENLAVNALGEKYYVTLTTLCDRLDNDTSVVDSTITIVNPVYTPIVINADLTNPSDSGATDGSINFTISGGVADYTTSVYKINSNTDSVLATIEGGNALNNLSAGTYRFFVVDFCADSPDLTKDFVLLNPPVNDDACAAITVAIGASGTYSNLAATTQSGEADIIPAVNTSCTGNEGWCLNQGLNASVWFKFVANEEGSYAVNVASLAFDPQIAIYKVEDCGTFTRASYQLIAANDDVDVNNNASKAFVYCAKPGETYYVLVDNANTGFGNFTFGVNQTAKGTPLILFNVLETCTDKSKDGIILTNVIEGAKPYNYAWSDGADVDDRFNLATGLYRLTVTDACGKVVSKDFTLNFKQSGNAGNDIDSTVFSNTTALDVATLPSANATPGGKFVGPTGDTLVSTVVNPSALGVGVYNYSYVVYNSCVDNITTIDKATLTVRVDLNPGIGGTGAASAYFSVMPNPNNGVFTLFNNGAAKLASVSIVDVSGKVVYNNTHEFANNGGIQLSLDQLAKGVYTIKLNGVNTNEYHRIVVQ